MVASKLWDVQDAVLDLLKTALGADPSTAKIPVDLGTPLKFTTTENVWISGEVQEWDQTYAVSGLAAKDESFTIRVCIVAQKLGVAYAPLRDRVRTIGSIIENAIHSDPQLDGLVQLAQVKPNTLEEGLVGDNKRAVGLNLDVEISAWLNA